MTPPTIPPLTRSSVYAPFPFDSSPTQTEEILSRIATECEALHLDLTESAVRHWVTQAGIDGGAGGTGALTTAERAELVGLRREARQLRMDREILKKAAAFFAKESQ